MSLFKQVWGWSVAEVGVVSGLLLLAGGLTGTWTSVRLTQGALRRGRPDAALRTLLIGLCIAGPACALYPQAPSGALAAAILFVALFALGVTTTAGPAALTAVAPGEIRAQLVAIYFLVVNIVGQFIGPPVVGWLADHLHGAHPLRGAMSLESVAVAVPAVIVVALGAKAFASAAREITLAEAGR